MFLGDQSHQGELHRHECVHAEQRLAYAGLGKVQMEYSYRYGDPFSERMLAWYEGPLGYNGPSYRESGFRMCRKRLEPRGRIGWICLKWMCAIFLWLFCGQY